MKSSNLFKYIIGCSLCAASLGSASEKNDRKIIENFFPSSLSSKLSSEGKPLTLADGGLSYIYKEVTLSREKSERDLVVLYQAWYATSEYSCMLSVIRADRKGVRLAPSTVINKPKELGNCDDIQLVDFNGDRTPEIIVTRVDQSGNTSVPYIFMWKTDRLVDITPTRNIDGRLISAFRNFNIVTSKVGKNLILIDSANNDIDNDLTTKTYLLDKGQFTLQGSYDFFQIIEQKSFWSQSSISFKPSFPAEAQYTLTVKNISDHNRAVRAEVTVNGSVVLKPQDFCKEPPHKRNDKKWWLGHDDDDDRDEDHFKRCVPKNEVYAIVNMKTANEIKVKVFGTRSSRIQLTLVKK